MYIYFLINLKEGKVLLIMCVEQATQTNKKLCVQD